MSVDHYFYRKDQTTAFTEKYLREKLSPDFEVTNVTSDKSTQLVRCFTVKPVNKIFDSFNEVKMEFCWQDVSGYSDKDIIEDFKKRGKPIRYYVNLLGYASFKTPYRADCIKYQAHIAELLDVVIGDPQNGWYDLSPQEYVSVKLSLPKPSLFTTIKNSLKKIIG